MISTAPKVVYIHEPFNIKRMANEEPKPFKHWFQHIDVTNESDYKTFIDGVVSYRYPFFRSLSLATNPRDMAAVCRDQVTSWAHKALNYRPLIKDPIAFFSAEWLSASYGMNVLVLIRHPAAFCSSLLINNWKFDFNELLEQPRLMDEYLVPFIDEIREQSSSEKDLIEQGILLWNCIHHTIIEYKQKHPEWVFVRHEDLSLNPMEEYQALFRKLGLRFTSHSEREILNSSGEHNPGERRQIHDIQRNSAENIHNWKTRLTPSDIHRIRIGTKMVADCFYDESDW